MIGVFSRAQTLPKWAKTIEQQSSEAGLSQICSYAGSYLAGGIHKHNLLRRNLIESRFRGRSRECGKPWTISSADMTRAYALSKRKLLMIVANSLFTIWNLAL
jgi:hypothetical protein